ncbi:MAG TPA: hypothetical protein VF615_24860 [Longimicrobiaceae bacterium]|jgi:hypothetical protein
MTRKREGGGRPKPQGRTSRPAAKRAGAAVDARVARLMETSVDLCDDDAKLQAALDLLRDPAEPTELRLAVVQAFQAASFSSASFDACRGEYLAALRQVADTPDPELRQRVLGILARENDGWTQQRLLEGLREPEKALVPAEKALQLLSYDVHAEAYPVAREIVRDPPNATARREALRLLAADADSAPVFEKILLDKDELAENRQLSAAALQSLTPGRLQEHARDILLDDAEYPEIQATSLSALTQFGDLRSVSGDAALLKRVDALSTAAPAKVKRSAREFLRRYAE